MARARGTFGIRRALAELGDVERSALIEAARQAATEALLKWKREILPRHFEASAYARYRPAAAGQPGVYLERSRRYERRKRRLGHWRMPMVFSGTLRRTLLSNPPRLLTAGRARGRITARMQTAHSPVLNLWVGLARRRGNRPHDFRASLSVFTRDEAADIQRFIGRRTVELVRGRYERSAVDATVFSA
jgi:hypothetical protein